jgi:hypothetical protein
MNIIILQLKMELFSLKGHFKIILNFNSQQLLKLKYNLFKTAFWVNYCFSFHANELWPYQSSQVKMLQYLDSQFYDYLELCYSHIFLGRKTL